MDSSSNCEPLEGNTTHHTHRRQREPDKMSFHRQSRKSKLWFDKSGAAIKRLTSEIAYADLNDDEDDDDYNDGETDDGSSGESSEDEEEEEEEEVKEINTNTKTGLQGLSVDVPSTSQSSKESQKETKKKNKKKKKKKKKRKQMKLAERDADAQDDNTVLEKDLARLVPETVHDRDLRCLLFGQTPTEESVATTVNGIRDLIRRFLRIRLRPGYAQGMHMVAALLLAKMRPEKALWCFVSVVEDVMPIDFYSKPPAAMQGFRVETELIVRLTVLMFPEMNDYGENVDESNLSVAVRMLAAKVLVPLFVDACKLEVTEAIWDRLLAVEGAVRGSRRDLLKVVREEAERAEQEDDDDNDGDRQRSSSSSSSSNNSSTSSSSHGTRATSMKVGAPGALIFIHVILGVVTLARPQMQPKQRTTALYQLLLDTVESLTVKQLPEVLSAVDKVYLDPGVIKKYRMQARRELSARWIENPGRLRKMVRREEVHFNLELLEKLRQNFAAVSEQTGVIDATMLRQVFRQTVDEGYEMPLPLDMFCDGVIRLHGTTEEGLAMVPIVNTDAVTGTTTTDDEPQVIGINFRELVSILSITLRGTLAQRLRLCFDIFDQTSSGYLKLDEAESMARAILRAPSVEEEARTSIDRDAAYVPPSLDALDQDRPPSLANVDTSTQSSRPIHNCVERYV